MRWWLIPVALAIGGGGALCSWWLDVHRRRALRREARDNERAARMAEWRVVNHRGEA